MSLYPFYKLHSEREDMSKHFLASVDFTKVWSIFLIFILIPAEKERTSLWKSWYDENTLWILVTLKRVLLKYKIRIKIPSWPVSYKRLEPKLFVQVKHYQKTLETSQSRAMFCLYLISLEFWYNPFMWNRSAGDLHTFLPL